MKNFNYVPIVLLTALFAFFIVSCGESDTDETENNDDIAADVENTDEAPDEDVDESVVPYPEASEICNSVGAIAQNLIFFDTDDKERQLAEWHQANNPDSKLIWLVFSTYDCPPCLVEKSDLPELNKTEYKDRGFTLIVIMNGLYLSGPEPDLEPEKVSKMEDDIIEVFGENGVHPYGYLKDQAVFRKFSKSGYPTNVLIDARTMEILDHFEGWDSSLTSQYNSFIDFVLDEL